MLEIPPSNLYTLINDIDLDEFTSGEIDIEAKEMGRQSSSNFYNYVLICMSVVSRLGDASI